jgi:hypothetical protein
MSSLMIAASYARSKKSFTVQLERLQWELNILLDGPLTMKVSR